ncbi:acyltransferase family protein [Nocardia sp. NPDC056952]|uniref:acyltransferase family protein n=1 Tax=Nocardia sp. NPDC056952 TaxID=3345979 RepID=UPI0036394699
MVALVAHSCPVATKIATYGSSWPCSNYLRCGVTKSDEAVIDPVARAEEKVRTRGGRFEFLDALRGLAASAVVIGHCGERLWPEYARFSSSHFGAGMFGVFVFFIVSGFIIPASLERGRSLAAFWVGRFFRLFPLFWGCLIAAMILHSVGRFSLQSGFLADPAWHMITNATMVQFFLGAPNTQVIGAAWTLSYELVFYLFVSLLFLGGLNRRSVPLVVLAIGSIVAALFLPVAMVNGPDANLVSRLMVVVVTVAVAVFFARRAATRRSAVAAVLLASIAVPLVLNQPGPSAYSATIFATMLVGTVLYRMTAGEISTTLGWGMFGFAACVILGFKFVVEQPHLDPSTGVWVPWWKEAVTMVCAYLLFGAALLLRRYSFPRPLLFLGRISFSLYLMHALVLGAINPWTTSVLGISAAWLTWCTWVIGSIALATLTYHAIEKPFHNLGRRLMDKMDAGARPAPTPVA